MKNTFLELTLWDNDFVTPFRMTVESLSNILYNAGVLDGQVVLTDKRLLEITKAANERFAVYMKFDVILGWRDSVPEGSGKLHIYNARIVTSDDIMPWNNMQTAYIQLTGYDKGNWFIV